MPEGDGNWYAKYRVGVLTAAHLTNREAALDGLSANEMSTTAATRQPARMHGKMMRGRYEIILGTLMLSEE